MTRLKRLILYVSCTCFEEVGEKWWWGGGDLVCVCVCVYVCVESFLGANGGRVMSVVRSHMVSMVLVLFGVDLILGNGKRI